MGVDGTHLVLEALESTVKHILYSEKFVWAYLGDTNDHVVDEGAESAEDSDVLPATLPDRQGHLVDLALHQPDVDISVSEVLREGTTGALDSDEAGLDVDFNALRNVEFFGLENVPHLERNGM